MSSSTRKFAADTCIVIASSTAYLNSKDAILFSKESSDPWIVLTMASGKYSRQSSAHTAEPELGGVAELQVVLAQLLEYLVGAADVHMVVGAAGRFRSLLSAALPGYLPGLLCLSQKCLPCARGVVCRKAD